MLPWRGADRMGDHFSDLAEVVAATGDAGAFSFDPDTGAGSYVVVPDAPDGTLTLSEQSNSDTFGYADPFETAYSWLPSITVNASSKQLVIVTAKVTGDSGITVGSDTLPSPWYLYAYDYTTDPTGAKAVGNGASGLGYAQASFWAENTTSSDASHDIAIYVRPSSTTSVSPLDCSLSVTVTVRTLYYA